MVIGEPFLYQFWRLSHRDPLSAKSFISARDTGPRCHTNLRNHSLFSRQTNSSVHHARIKKLYLNFPFSLPLPPDRRCINQSVWLKHHYHFNVRDRNPRSQLMFYSRKLLVFLSLHRFQKVKTNEFTWYGYVTLSKAWPRGYYREE